MLLRESGAHLTIQATSRKTSVVAPEMVSIIGVVMGGRLRKMRKLRPRRQVSCLRSRKGWVDAMTRAQVSTPARAPPTWRMAVAPAICIQSMFQPQSVKTMPRESAITARPGHPEIASISPKAVVVM